MNRTVLVVCVLAAGCGEHTRARPVVAPPPEPAATAAAAGSAAPAVATPAVAHVAPLPRGRHVLVKSGAAARWQPQGDTVAELSVGDTRPELLARTRSALRVRATLPAAELWPWLSANAVEQVTKGPAELSGADGTPALGSIAGGVAVEVIGHAAGRTHIRTKMYWGSNTLSLDASVPDGSVGTDYIGSAPPQHPADTHQVVFSGAEYEKAPLPISTHAGGVPIATLEQGGAVFGWTAAVIGSEGAFARVSVEMKDDEDFWIVVRGVLPKSALKALPKRDEEPTKEAVGYVEGGTPRAAEPGVPAGSCLYDAREGTPVGKLARALPELGHGGGWGRVPVAPKLELWVQHDGDGFTRCEP